MWFARRQIDKLGRKGKEKYDDMWKELARKLNQLKPEKSDSSWQRVNFVINFKLIIYIIHYLLQIIKCNFCTIIRNISM